MWAQATMAYLRLLSDANPDFDFSRDDRSRPASAAFTRQRGS
jgi:hypothetical protein